MYGKCDIEFYRFRGYSFVGHDGEMWHFVKNGFAYAYHQDIGFFAVASFDCMYSHARDIEGKDHARAEVFLPDHYAELNDVHLYPNQRKAWRILA